MAIPPKVIGNILGRYGFSASLEACAKIDSYISILLKWNKHISLTTITDPAEIVRFHFGESIFAASTVPIENGRLADVGTGAGFPGLALKIARPGISVTLIESNQKKCAFLGEVVRSLGLDNVEMICGRMEDISPRRQVFDYITARAVGQIGKFLLFGENNLSSSGLVVMWLGESDVVETTGDFPNWKWNKNNLIPETDRRVILSGSLKHSLK